MNKDKRNNIQLLGTLNNSDESGIIANANQIYDANEDKSTQDVSKEHKERIETLETKENSMQTTLENITKTGEASAASNVTYNHSDSKLDATNVQQAVDEVRKRSNYNDGDNIIDFNTIHLITDNPEYICVAVDADDRILYGIKANGQPYFGVGCPQQVKDYIDKQINKILGTDDITTTIDSLKEIEAFLKDFTNSDTLKVLLDTKANKTDVDNTVANINAAVKQLQTADQTLKENIDAEVQDYYKKSNYNDGDNIIDFNTIHIITDNPEFTIAVVDANDRILYGIKADGQPYWGVGVPKVVRDYVDKQVNDILGTDNITETIDSLKEVEKFLSDFKNSDTLKALLDTKANKTDVDNTTANINADIADKYKKSNPNDEEGNVIDTNSIKSVVNNPEYFKAFVDNTNKLIEAIGLDGVRKFFAGINVQGTLQCVIGNPDYIVAYTDKDNKIIFGIQHDGNPYFGYGVPRQIKNVIDKINADIVDKYTEVKKSLSDIDKHISETVTNVDEHISETSADIDKKINLGNNVYPSAVHEVSEFENNTSILLDNLNHILESVGSDGIRNFFAGINVRGNKFTTTDNPEYKAVLLDKDNKIIIGVRNDGDIYFAAGVPKQVTDAISQLVKDIEQLQDKINLGFNTYPKDVNNIVDNSEYAKVLADADNKVLEGIEPDGTHKFNNTVDLKGTKSTTIDYEDYSQLLCDKDNKIIDSIDDKGVVNHNTKHIFKNGIEDTTGGLKKEALQYTIDNSSDLAKALKDGGYSITATDWSNYISNDGDNPLYLPEPYRAYINFITNDGLERLGTIDGQKAVMEFYDGYGNYFKKNVSIDQQGDSSRAQWKRNIAIDMFDSEQGGDAFAVKFGDWVAQDSYHLKAYYEDIIRGINVINYKLCDRIARDRGVLADRPYKEYINPKQNDAGSNNHDNDILNDARTISDGFPVIVYLNGDFYGVFVMQLKKHRDNFNMDRNATDNIHLDGYLAGSDFWNGKVNWHRFEIRNPKPKSKKWTLLCQDGNTYNGDNAQEIMGTDSSKYDASNTSCVKSAELKANIIAVSRYMSDIKVFEDTYIANNTEENLSKVKTEIEKRFGVSQMIDLVIALNICGDGDITKNVQWVTWGKINDTLKMFSCPWDMDGAYGVESTHGFVIGGIGRNTAGNIDNYPLKYIYKYYMTDLKARYKELRDNNIISPSIIQNMVMDWVHRIGDNNYKLEYKKWDESPCHRDFGASNAWKLTWWTGIDRRPYEVTYYSEGDSYSPTATYAKDAFAKVNHVLYQSLQDNNQGHDVTETTWWEVVSWQEGKTYNKGDMVYDGVDTFHLFTAQENTNERPFKTLYKHYPKEGGNYDSALRICKWIEDKFVSLDKEMEYKQ